MYINAGLWVRDPCQVMLSPFMYILHYYIAAFILLFKMPRLEYSPTMSKVSYLYQVINVLVL